MPKARNIDFYAGVALLILGVAVLLIMIPYGVAEPKKVRYAALSPSGVTIGTFVGAVPGMTTPMAVALTLPFTFTLPPVNGILLLLGVYKGGIYGGSITAILINAPGTPAASCTVLDGYPLAKKGEARWALDIALYASCVADFISNLALILFAGMLASLALAFGSPEVFTLIMFSLTIIAGVSGNQLLKGLGSACLGLLLATIGLELVYGANRFVFGQVNLMSGLNFIPVLIGLFALPEIIAFLGRKETKREHNPLAGVSATLSDFRRCLKTIARGSWSDSRYRRRAGGFSQLFRSKAHLP